MTDKSKINSHHATGFKDEITASENIFKDAFINRLQSEGISCEVAHNQFVPCPVKGNIPDDLFKIVKQKDLYDGYQLLRPDFFIIKFGICIQIDGDIHEVNQRNVDKDLLRDLLFGVIGIPTIRIPNRDVNDPETLKKRIDEIITLIRAYEASPGFKTRRNRLKAIISKARRKA